MLLCRSLQATAQRHGRSRTRSQTQPQATSALARSTAACTAVLQTADGIVLLLSSQIVQACLTSCLTLLVSAMGLLLIYDVILMSTTTHVCGLHVLPHITMNTLVEYGRVAHDSCDA